MLPGFSPRIRECKFPVWASSRHQRAEPKPATASEARSPDLPCKILSINFSVICNTIYFFVEKASSQSQLEALSILTPVLSVLCPVQPANERVFLCQRAAAIDPNERAGSRHSGRSRYVQFSQLRPVSSQPHSRNQQNIGRSVGLSFITVMFNQASESKTPRNKHILTLKLNPNPTLHTTSLITPGCRKNPFQVPAKFIMS